MANRQIEHMQNTTFLRGLFNIYPGGVLLTAEANSYGVIKDSVSISPAPPDMLAGEYTPYPLGIVHETHLTEGTRIVFYLAPGSQIRLKNTGRVLEGANSLEQENTLFTALRISRERRRSAS